MTLKEVYEYFGSAYKIALTLGITNAAIYGWNQRGRVPYLQQKKLEKLTKGALKTDVIKYKRKKVGITITIEEEDDSIFYPAFRYADPKHGICTVQSLVFRKSGSPKIIYTKPGSNYEKFYSFHSENLMQALDFKDAENNRLYIGDIIQLKDKRKLKILGLGAQLLDMLGIQENYKIIGNIHEGK
jgi:hypothetical protein